jgi:uncharacterized protein with FMN-binding domain
VTQRLAPLLLTAVALPFAVSALTTHDATAAAKKATPTPKKAVHKKTKHRAVKHKATATPTPKPKATHKKKAKPTATPRPKPTRTPRPTATPTPRPTATPTQQSQTVNGNFTGSAASSRWGSVQVTIDVSGGKITDVQVNTKPETARSQIIDQRALPILKTEVLQAQSARIDAVSGATQLSEAYIQSLRSAVNQAGL